MVKETPKEGHSSCHRLFRQLGISHVLAWDMICWAGWK